MGDNIPHSLSDVVPYHTAVTKLAHSQGLTVYEICLLYVFQQTWVDYIVIGIDSIDQARVLIETVRKLSVNENQLDFSALACNDKNLINPTKWAL
jgi:aryl-alcohol dehydrogenase-like predicted oxidoreductase